MLDKRIIKDLLEFGKKSEATHLIVFFDSSEGRNITRFVHTGQTVDEIISSILKYGNSYSVKAIYNYDLDLDEQLKEICPYHREKSIKYKSLYEKAIEYATTKHEGKYRKGSDHKPYITHPIEVSKYVEKYMKNDQEIEKYKISAILHDTLENTDATYEEEKEMFGKDIADIVLEVTNDNNEKDRLGKDVYLANKMTFMKDKTLTLKLCDRLHNVSELSSSSDDFNEKYVRETIYIINYILLYRKLNETHLILINDIMNKIKEVSVISPVLIKPKKKTYHL